MTLGMLSFATDAAAKSPHSPQRPYNVCMHLGNMARTDFRVMRDATALVAAGFNVTIVDIEKDHARPAQEEIDGVTLKHIYMPIWFVPVSFKPWFLVKFVVMVMHGVITLLRCEADIYHAHEERALMACFVVARLRQKPLIFDAPDLTFSNPNIIRWRRLRLFAAGLLAYMVTRCSAVITASPYYIAELRNIYHASNVTVIRNMPVYRAVARNERLRQTLGLGPEVRLALYQGNIQANRGLDRLVRAAKFIGPNIVIVMMGGGVESIRSQLDALITSEHVADHVKLLPFVPHGELLEWTASADIGLTIFPPDYSLSIRFTLPNKLFEYLMVGLPVLSSQLDAIAEVIKIYDVGRIVPSLAPEDLGSAINALLMDTSALARMHKNALEIAQQEFHWGNESQKLIQLYRAVLVGKDASLAVSKISGVSGETP